MNEVNIDGFIGRLANHPYHEQYYCFVHIFLKLLAFARPELLRVKLASRGARRYLVKLWNQNGASGSEEAIPAGAFSCCVKKYGKAGLLVVITLPEPIAACEAYFIGIYFYPARRSFFRLVDQKIRYFTLEKSYTSEGAPSAFLCEWEIDDHLNHGIFNELTIDAFAEKVKILAKSGWRDSRIGVGVNETSPLNSIK